MSTQKKMISVDAEPSKAVRVRLVGQIYSAREPKAALAMRLSEFDGDGVQKDPKGAVAALESLVRAMFAKDASKVLDRLDDPEDALDIPHISQLANALIEAGQNPPT